MTRSEARIPTLDGWRGVAISAVVISHCGMLYGASSRFNMVGPEAVGLFFAISGFLITTLLLREEEKSGRISLKNFYIRRFFRIFPPAGAYLFLLCVIAWMGFLALKKGEISATLLLVNNYWDNKTWYTGHFWSLAIEEHFYLIWPLILALGGRSRALKIGIAVIIAEILWRPFGVNFLKDLILYQRTDMRLDAFAWACCAAIEVREGRLKWLSSKWVIPGTVFALLLVHVTPHTWQNFRYAANALLMTLLVVGTVQRPEGFAGRFLESSRLRAIGLISYSLYLWQQLLISEAVPAPLAVKLVALVVIAIASYRLIETPFIGWGKIVIRRLLPARNAAGGQDVEGAAASKPVSA